METSVNISCRTLEELPETAAVIVDFARQRELTIWLLEGEMGAGKTTLSKAICRQLGVEDVVQSPTFSIVNEYRTVADDPVYHFDFYRIRDVEEALQIGVEEYFYSGAICLVEWPSKIEAILPETFLRIQIEVDIDSARKIQLTINE